MLKRRPRLWIFSAILCTFLVGANPLPALSFTSPIPTEVERVKLWDGNYAKGEILLKVTKDISSSELSSAFSEGPLTIKEYRQISDLLGYRYVHIKSQKKSTRQLMDYYLKDSRVIEASPNYVNELDIQLPNDSRFNELWGLHNTGQNGGKLDADIDAPEAWHISNVSQEVVLVSMDTGVDYTHQDLKNNIYINQLESNGNTGIDDDGNGYIDDIYGYDFAGDNNGINDSDPMDENGHGTHTSGTMAAAINNNLGIAGVCPTAKVMPVKVFRPNKSGFDSDILEAITYILKMKAAGVNIVAVNASYGGSGYNGLMKDAISSLNQSGIIFCASAGNNGSNTEQSPHYPSSYDLPGILSVAATDRTDTLANFSNYGISNVDLAAPGVAILSSFPNNAYISYSGTSMSTPHVTGAIGVLAQQYPDDSIFTRINKILTTVDYLPNLQGKCVTSGRLNLFNALNSYEQIQFKTNTYSVNEGDKVASIEVVRTLGSTGEVSVNYTTSNDSAITGEDYSETSGTLIFATGQSSQVFYIPIIDDNLVESNEAVTLTLSNPSVGAKLGSQATAQLFIIDNDTQQPPQYGEIHFSTTLSTITEDAGKANIEVIRTNGSDGNVSIAYSSSDGTAIAGEDYQSVSGNLQFAPGETSKSFSIPIIDDSLHEVTETFHLTLTNPSGGAIIGENVKATVQITDNDIDVPNYGKLQFSASSYNIQEGNTALIDIIRSGGSDGNVIVCYRTTLGGTAIPRDDYAPALGRLTFAKGVTKQTIKVYTMDDRLAETPESVTLELLYPSGGAKLGEPKQATLTIIDND